MWAQAVTSSTQAKLAVLVVTLVPLYYSSYRLHPTFSHGSPDVSFPVQPLSPEEWRKLWLSADLLQPFDPLAIQMKCNQTRWESNLVFNLQGSNGGIGNVRAHVTDFLFYAMEVGASIVLPDMTARQDDNLYDVWSAGREHFGYMFDEAHFRKSIAEACPQMVVYGQEEVETGWRTVEQTYDTRIPKARRDSSKEEWVQQTKAWLVDHGVETETPTIVNVEHTIWETNTRAERAEFRVALGMLLRSPPDIRRYAAAATYNLGMKYGIEMLPWANIHPDAYYGAHLRTEADTIDAGWLAPPSSTEVGLGFAAQTDYYMEAAASRGLSMIFVASGNASEIEKFQIKAESSTPPITVTSKWDLLSEAESRSLQSMHWDQQALVDVEMLKRCSVFGGMAKSSFAFLIAMARTAWMEQHKMVQDAWFAPHEDAMVAFDNRLSTIWGRNQLNEERVPSGAWP